MKEKYKELYKGLIEAYYNHYFEETFAKMLEEDFEDKVDAKEILATLCGAEIDTGKDDFEFVQALDAITQNRVREKIVQRPKKRI